MFLSPTLWKQTMILFLKKDQMDSTIIENNCRLQPNKFVNKKSPRVIDREIIRIIIKMLQNKKTRINESVN